MTKIIEWLKGKKTYIVLAGAIITAIGAYTGDAITGKELLAAIFAALTGAGFRSAVSK